MSGLESSSLNRRQINFDETEELILLQIVEKHKNIIECKKTGATTWLEKKKCWENISRTFNSQSTRSVHRNADQLKEKYNNLKKKSKKRISENKTNIIKTGGGFYVPNKITSQDQIMYNIIGPQVDGLSNAYDDDAPIVQNNAVEFECTNEIEYDEVNEGFNNDHYQENMIEANKQPIIIERNEIIEDIDNLEDSKRPKATDENKNHDWATYSSKDLKRPVSKKLCKKQKKLITTTNHFQKKYIPISHELMEEKLEFVRLQKTKFLEEHEIKMKILRRKVALADKKCCSQNIEINDKKCQFQNIAVDD